MNLAVNRQKSMPKGYRKTDDANERLDQQAEIAHKKMVADLLGRFPGKHAETVEGEALVGKLRRALKDSPS